MSDSAFKLILICGGALLLGVVLFFNEFTAAVESLIVFLAKTLAAIVLCAMAYTGYFNLRLGLTGVDLRPPNPPPTSGFKKYDPTSASERFGAFALGLISWIGVVFGAALLFHWDWPFRLLFGK
jgi:hypothetical protein